MKRLPRILVATPSSETFDRLRALLSDDAELMVVNEGEQALALLAEQEFDALIADNRLGNRMARVVASAFVRDQPVGRAVLLASLEDPDTLMRLDINSKRLEVIFRPWNDWELRTCLLGQSLEATGTA